MPASEPTPLTLAAEKVGAALRKVATAASDAFGGDCYAHAHVGAALLRELGFPARAVVGFASWRVGRGDSDVISHVPSQNSYLPPGAEGFAYHAWVECNDAVVDFTTYQLVSKAQALDAADGGHTQVDWCPNLLVMPFAAISSYREVAQAPCAGVAYYARSPEVEALVEEGARLDEAYLPLARLLMNQPDLVLFGPNTLGLDS